MTTEAENIQAEREFEQTLVPNPDEVQASPFLPGTNIQYAWDSTSLGWLKGCPRLYQYMMIEGWRPREDSDDLKFGLEFHAALEEMDHRKADREDWLLALREVVRGLLVRTFGWKTSNEYKNRPNLLRTVVWYIDKHRDDPAKTYIMADGRAAVEVTFKFELDFGPMDGSNAAYVQDEASLSQPYLLCGHLDRVVDFQDSLYVMDHKTTKSQPSSWYFSAYDPDNQMTLYTLAGRVIFDSPVKGVIIDAVQVLQETSAFGRGFTHRTQDQINEWLYDLRFLFAQAEDYAGEGYWPMNDKYCGTYRSEASGRIGCPFREICGSSPKVRERFLKSNFTQLPQEERWNPLKAR